MHYAILSLEIINKGGTNNVSIFFDYSKLKGKAREKGLRQKDIAVAANISSVTYSQKLNNHSLFTQGEIQAIAGVLSIGPSEIGEYFFTPKV